MLTHLSSIFPLSSYFTLNLPFPPLPFTSLMFTFFVNLPTFLIPKLRPLPHAYSMKTVWYCLTPLPGHNSGDLVHSIILHILYRLSQLFVPSFPSTNSYHWIYFILTWSILRNSLCISEHTTALLSIPSHVLMVPYHSTVHTVYNLPQMFPSTLLFINTPIQPLFFY